MSDYLSSQQIDQLLAGINSRRVQHRDGQSHLEAYDVRAHLTRIFGFGRWSADLLDHALLFEQIGPKNGDANAKDVVSVGYSATVRLTICAPDGTVLCTFTEAATGDATNFPMTKRADAHDFAIKTAESQAFKRTAINLGDQFGLSLYRKGSLEPLVLRTLVGQVVPLKDGEQKTETPAAVDADAPEIVPESEQIPEPPTETTERPAVTPPAPDAPVEDRQERADLIRQRLLDLDPGMDRQKRLRAIAALKIEAGRGRLLQVQVGDPAGEYVVSLNELLDGALRSPAAA